MRLAEILRLGINIVTQFIKNKKTIWFLLVFFILVIGCTSGEELKDFDSDGCSLFPDRSLISNEDWCECCFEHDVAYWQGGTEEERMFADIELRDCISKKTGNKKLSEMMYAGVRFGGSPYFYTWYRWGYGWDFDRKYIELTEEEKLLVEQKLNDYYKNSPNGPCP